MKEFFGRAGWRLGVAGPANRRTPGFRDTEPTAQQFDAEVHVTSLRKLSCAALALGEVMMDHALPFQRSMSVWLGGEVVPLKL